MSEDCCKYGVENINDNILAKGASIYGDARKHVEKEQEEFNKLLSSQVDLCRSNIPLSTSVLLVGWFQFLLHMCKF